MRDDKRSDDARFEDAAEAPLRLSAETAEDLTAISALIQDAVLNASDISWMPRRQRLALLINRFRWEDAEAAKAAGRPYERTRALLTVNSALRVRASGIDPRAADLVLSLLTLEFAPGEDGTGVLTLVLAGDGEIAADVECIDLTLTDVTRPYVAPSGKLPEHG